MSKMISLKLQEQIFEESEEIVAQLGIARNRYINDALKLYNAHQRRKLLRSQIAKESQQTRKHSLEVLAELDALDDDANDQ